MLKEVNTSNVLIRKIKPEFTKNKSQTKIRRKKKILRKIFGGYVFFMKNIRKTFYFSEKVSSFVFGVNKFVFARSANL